MLWAVPTSLLLTIFRPCLAIHSPPAIYIAIAKLRPLLSPGAIVTLPNTTHFLDLGIRASSPRVSPDYTAVIEVATSKDVQVVVRTANHYDVPFLAISGAHGWTRTLNKMQGGIQINMRKLNTTTLSSDGKTAVVGGGTLQYEITRALFEKNKYAGKPFIDDLSPLRYTRLTKLWEVTGLAECVSVAGPLLGGGHSLLQNQYGYALDNLISARVVVASGQEVEASKQKNPDLFWALQGAGHNFGIITSFELKAYDVPSNWTVYTLVYTSEKLEALFNLINDFEKPGAQRPTKLALTGIFIKLPEFDAINVSAKDQSCNETDFS